MPEGWSNYLLGVLILGLKIRLLPRTYVPAFALHITASLGTSVIFLAGWHQAEPFGSALVSLTGIGAAKEANYLVLGIAETEERREVQLWCALLGILLCAVAWYADPEPYPNYPLWAYLLRVYCGIFSIAWLIALLGYCLVVLDGIRPGIIHAGILLLRLLALTGILFVHSPAHWYLASNLGGILNVLTLAAWIGLNPLRAYFSSASYSVPGRLKNPASLI